MTFDPFAGLIESLPENIPLDDPEPDHEGAPETGSARSARERRDAAQRKRDERARRKAGGMPDPRVIDSAIATAIADICIRANFRGRAKAKGSMRGLAIGLDAIVGQVMQVLVEERNVGQPQAKRAAMQRLGLTRQS